jgi:hypothetical protein
MAGEPDQQAANDAGRALLGFINTQALNHRDRCAARQEPHR